MMAEAEDDKPVLCACCPTCATVVIASRLEHLQKKKTLTHLSVQTPPQTQFVTFKHTSGYSRVPDVYSGKDLVEVLSG